MSDGWRISDNGGPAFPSVDLVNYGMSLRDYFAAQAMSVVLRDLYKHGDEWSGGGTVFDVAHEAYQMADAMLAERAK